MRAESGARAERRPLFEPSLLRMDPNASMNSCRSRLPPPSVSARSKRSLSERIWAMEIEPSPASWGSSSFLPAGRARGGAAGRRGGGAAGRRGGSACGRQCQTVSRAPRAGSAGGRRRRRESRAGGARRGAQGTHRPLRRFGVVASSCTAWEPSGLRSPSDMPRAAAPAPPAASRCRAPRSPVGPLAASVQSAKTPAGAKTKTSCEKTNQMYGTNKSD